MRSSSPIHTEAHLVDGKENHLIENKLRDGNVSRKLEGISSSSFYRQSVVKSHLGSVNRLASYKSPFSSKSPSKRKLLINSLPLRSFSGEKTPVKNIGFNGVKSKPSQLGHSSSRSLFDVKSEAKEDKPDALTSIETSQDLSFLGLPNIGNSCYMNSCLQALLNIKSFVDDLLSNFEVNLKRLSEKSLIKCIASIIIEQTNTCTPSDYEKLLVDLKNSVTSVAPIFMGNHQHDAQEFLCQILDQLKDEVNQMKKENENFVDPVTENFQFEILNSYECKSCGEVTSRSEPNLMLSMDIPLEKNNTHVTLQDALNSYFEPCSFSRICEKCRGEETVSTESITKLPRVLIIHLKRYQLSSNIGIYKKTQPVLIPVFLNIKNFVSNDTKLASNPKPVAANNAARIKTLLTTAANGQDTKKRKADSQLQNGAKKVSPQIPPSNDDKESQISAIPVKEENLEINVPNNDDVKDMTILTEHSLQTEEDLELQTALLNSIRDNPNFSYYMPSSEETEFYIDELEFNKENVETITSPYSSVANYTYKLMGVVSHIGENVQLGHYVCDVSYITPQLWVHFNDNIVNYTNQRDVLRKCAKTGYLFFYVAKELWSTCK